MPLNFANGEPFATGCAPYEYSQVPGSGDACRIIVQVEVNGAPVEAILDTGGGYFFCKPELAESLGLDPANALESLSITLKRETVKGVLHRIDLTLIHDKSENGKDLPLEVTAFLPDPDQPFEENFLPYSYLGMLCCMDRVRFAIDPSQDQDGVDRFYFGAQP